MLFRCDATGFPTVFLPQATFEIHLLPVTKHQFAAFVRGADKVSEADFAAMLALNPDAEPAKITSANREQLFVAGVLSHEAEAFAGWLGPGFRLPTEEEWRAAYSELELTTGWSDVLEALLRDQHPLANKLCPAAKEILRQRINDGDACSFAEALLFRGGVVEWVQSDGKWVGLGAPRPEFQPNLWDPLTHEVVPLHEDERVRYFGFRLLRRNGGTA